METLKMKIDIHNYGHQLDLAILRAKADKQISKTNKELILSFIDYLVAEGISKPRLAKYTDIIRYWAIWLKKDFPIVTKEDIAKTIPSNRYQLYC